ncbi:MAG: lysophospholipid acyltransferase family protein, partial [Kiritimatiellae bacterium]|nr:lysophospholipid acyltransferase family protein [Kiritimatiellia bacterium]
MFKRRFKIAYRQFRRPFEWLLIGLGQILIPRLSRRGTVRLAKFMANSVYLLDSESKDIARANLRLMFGERMTPYREAAIIRRSFQSMARVLVNVFWLSRNTRSRVMEQVEFAPGVLDKLRRTKPMILVSAHIGNWEILSQALAANGIPVMSVAKKLGSRSMTRRLVKMRSTIGQQIVSTDGAIRSLVAALKQGVSIGLLIDQHIHTWEGGAWINFFGVPAGISLTPAALARKNRAPIFFGWSRPLKDGRYRIEYEHCFPYDPAIDDAERTQQIVDSFERVIRRHPSLWCLNYRRWRYV